MRLLIMRLMECAKKKKRIKVGNIVSEKQIAHDNLIEANRPKGPLSPSRRERKQGGVKRARGSASARPTPRRAGSGRQKALAKNATT
jgi:hypothetical protein